MKITKSRQKAVPLDKSGTHSLHACGTQSVRPAFEEVRTQTANIFYPPVGGWRRPKTVQLEGSMITAFLASRFSQNVMPAEHRSTSICIRFDLCVDKKGTEI